jgi:hypothetical protein
LPKGQAANTKMGIIPAAIWIEDPTLTPIVISILPFMAILQKHEGFVSEVENNVDSGHAYQTEVTCSAEDGKR